MKTLFVNYDKYRTRSPEDVNWTAKFCVPSDASVWNSLPSTMRDSSLSLRTFKRRLKTYLFGRGQ